MYRTGSCAHGNEWDIVQLANIVENSPSLPALQIAFNERHYIHNIHLFETSYQTIIDGDIDSYYERKHVQMKHRLKNIRMIDKLGTVELQHVESQNKVEDYLTRLFSALKTRDMRLGRLGLEGDYLKYYHFFQNLCRTEQMRKYVRYSVTTLNGEPIDYNLYFVDDKAYYDYKGCFEENFAKFQPGYVRRIKLYELARKEGRYKIDLLRGTEAYKMGWADQQLSLFMFEARPRYGWALIICLWQSIVQKTLHRIGLLLIVHRSLRRLADKIACHK